MPRKSLVHYIAPSAISITPNCNESANDLAVSLIRGAKIKVFSPAVGLETEDGYFQEWTLYGRNRRLADSAGNDGHRYTIYARLPKAKKDGGYLVFAQMTKDEDDEWVDKYWHVTSKGYSRRDDNRLDEDFDPDDPPQTDEDEKKMQKNNWWFRLGEVSEPSGGQRTVTLDTGILGTDQFNTEWNLVQEGLHVDLTCRLLEPYTPDPEGEVPEPEGEDAGPTPYVPWGYWLRMQAELAGVRDDEVVEVKKWEITRSTGAGSIDWLDDEDPRKEYFEKEGKIILSHTRGEEGTDDFEAAVSLVFTVTAWGTKRERTDKDDEEEEQEPVVVVQDGDEGEEGDDGEILAMATITIMSETNEQYALQLSETIVNYDDDEEEFRPETVTVRVRSTDQRTAVTNITTGQMAAACLAVQYALADDLDTWIPLEFDDNTDDPDNPFAEAFIGGGEESVFYEGQNIIVRLVMTEQEEGQEGFTVVKELSRKTILNYYNLDAKYVTVGFFRKLFAVHHIGDDGNDEIIETNRKIKDEDEDPTVNIEAKRGFWSPSYVSALGQGSNAGGGGGGGGGDPLEWPLQDINNADMPRNPSIGDTIVWNGSTFTWGAGLDTTKLATWLQSNDYKKQADLDLRYLRLRSDTVQTVQSQLLLTGNVAISGATLTIAHPQGFDPKEAADNVVLTKGETATVFDERYVTINWFKKLFEARTQGGTAVDPNKDGIIDNLKVLVGTWTEQYVSALGTGSQGGSGGVWYLSQLEDVNVGTLSPSDNGKALIYNSSQGRWVKGNAGMDETQLTTFLGTYTGFDTRYLTDAKLKSQYRWWGAQMDASGIVAGNMSGVGSVTAATNGASAISGFHSINLYHSGTNGAHVDFHWSTSGFTSRIIEGASGRLDLNNTIFAFHTTSNNYGGCVGIGTVTPYTNLHVSGGVRATKFYLHKPYADSDTGAVWLQYDNNGGVRLYNAGFYADTFVSALGTGSDGGAGGVDLSDVWYSLTHNEAPYANTKINNSHLNFNTSFGTMAYESSSDYVLASEAVFAVKVNNSTYYPGAYGIVDLGTISVTGDYLPLTGGTLTGNLRVKGAHDLSQSNNGITGSSNSYYGYYIVDANNKRSAQYINTVSPSGSNAFWMSVTYDVSGAQEQDKGFGLTVDKQGNCTWNISAPDKFREALGINLGDYTKTQDFKSLTIKTDQSTVTTYKPSADRSITFKAGTNITLDTTTPNQIEIKLNDLSGKYVTLDTAQTITGVKTFNSAIGVLGGITPIAGGHVNIVSGAGRLWIKKAQRPEGGSQNDGTPNNGMVFECGSGDWVGRLYMADNGQDGIYWGGVCDGSIQEWRKLAFASQLDNYVTLTTAQTITGLKTFEYTVTDRNTPLLKLNDKGTVNESRLIWALRPNMTSQQWGEISIGKSATSKNLGQLAYKHVGDGSNNNFISLGIYGVGAGLCVYGNKSVYIGGSVDEAPSSTLHVNGTGCFSGDLLMESWKYIKFKIGSDYTSALGVWGTSYNLLQLGYYTASEKSYATNIYGNTLRLYGSATTLGMLINTSGNVGVGTDSPGAKLDVSGSLRASMFLTSWNATGSNGTIGFVHIATITVASAWASMPLKFRVTQRGRMGGELTVRFLNANSAAGTSIDQFFYTGDIAGASIVQSGTTFSLYIRKAEGYDSIGITLVDYGAYAAGNLSVVWANNHWSYPTVDGKLDTSATPGNINATCRYYFDSNVYMEYDSANKGVRVYNSGLYADTYVSSLGAGSIGESGATNLLPPLDAINTLGTPTRDKSVIMYNLGSNRWEYQTISGSGSGGLSSIAMYVPTGLTVGTSPNTSNTNATITGTSGVFYLGFGTTTANRILGSGSNGVVSWRALEAADIPNLSWNKITTDKPTTLSGYGISESDITAGKASKLAQTIQLWGNPFNGTQNIGYVNSDTGATTTANLNYVKNISMAGTVTGCTSIDQMLYFSTTNSRIGIGTSSPEYSLDVVGQMRLRETSSSTPALTYGVFTNAHTPYIRFKDPAGSMVDIYLDTVTSGGTTKYPLRIGDTSRQTRVIGSNIRLYSALENGSTSYTPAIVTAYGGRVLIGGTDTNDTNCKLCVNGNICTSTTDQSYIKIGGAKIIWDNANQALHIDKGVYSDSFVSSLGMGSGGSSGFDTTNTAGVNRSNGTLLYLVGSKTYGTTGASDYDITYTSTKCYIGSDNCLYSNGSKVLTEASGGGSGSDTQDTAGIYQSANEKLYLIGSKSGPLQTTNAHAQTYENSACYIGTDNCLYSNSKKVLSAAGGSVTSGHLYLEGAQDRSATSNTTQIVFGTNSAFKVALSGISGALVINSTTSVGNNNTQIGTGSANTYFNSTGDFIIGASSVPSNVNSPKFYVNGNSCLNGSVAIGTAVNTSYKLKVSGSAYVSDLRIGDNVRLYPTNVATGADVLDISAAGLRLNGNSITSDIRKKDVLSMVDDLTVEKIARAPIFNFKWKQWPDGLTYVGTSAQYWDTVLPNAVMYLDDVYSLDYGATALAAAVMTARTVLSHEERIKALEVRIKAMEQENRQLRNEIELLNAA